MNLFLFRWIKQINMLSKIKRCYQINIHENILNIINKTAFAFTFVTFTTEKLNKNR